MTPAEMEAIIAELEAGFLAETGCEQCFGSGNSDDEGVPCSACDGCGLILNTDAGEQAAEGIWERRKQRAEEFRLRREARG